MGKQHIDRLQSGHLKVFGQHSDHLDRIAVYINSLVENAAIQVVMGEPKAVGDERHLWPVGEIFLRQEVSPEDRRDPKRG